jgi:hypothetical protein
MRSRRSFGARDAISSGTVRAARPRRSASNELRWIAEALSEARNLDVFASRCWRAGRALRGERDSSD